MPVKNCNGVEKLKTGRGKDLCAGISWKTRTNNKPTTTGKQTTIIFNNSQRTKETLGLYIHYTGGLQAEKDKIQTDYKHHRRQEVT